MPETIRTCRFADMEVHYLRDKNGGVSLRLLPADCGLEPAPEAEPRETDSLVQLHYAGDAYPSAYTGGVTLRRSETSLNLVYRDQTVLETADSTEIRTRLTDAHGGTVCHHLRYTSGDFSVECWSSVENTSAHPLTLELLSSFSLSGITPYVSGDAYGRLLLHRIRSVWSMEGRVCSQRPEDLQLEPSWSGHAVRCERYGQVGSMPVSRFFPFGAVEDTENGVVWGAQLAHNASWQMEFYRKDDTLDFSGGLADFEFGHWRKTLAPGESFQSPHAILSVCRGGGLDRLTQRLTWAGMKAFRRAPAGEQSLPVLFNEYCTTWGVPSHENICSILDAIRGKGFAYFVIDAGWYKADGIPWDRSMGDWQVSQTLFPQGMEQTTAAIREAGMVPGIWFEIDNVGNAAQAYHLEEHLLHRDGRPLTNLSRRFWDLRQDWVQNYLAERVIGTLKQYGFGYMKMDYNENVGLGCDGADSLGEGLRQNAAASVRFIQRVKREIPDIVLENCASGGHRLEPLMMSLCSMASFSDAHECPEIPVIAANLHRTILPAQSQIWAVIQASDSLQRIAYSICNTFLGRLCLSGNVLHLSPEQWRVIDQGIAFYQRIAPVIKEGFTIFHGTPVLSYRHLEGWQGIVRLGRAGEAYAVLHTFGGQTPEEIVLPLPCEAQTLEVYSFEEEDLTVHGNTLRWKPHAAWKAAAVRLSIPEGIQPL